MGQRGGSMPLGLAEAFAGQGRSVRRRWDQRCRGDVRGDQVISRLV